MMQKYYKYLHTPGDTSLSFKDFVRDYFGENLDDLKKGGLVRWVIEARILDCQEL